MTAINLIFFGAGEFGIPTLARLVRDHRVNLIVTQPDRPAGRGSKLTPTPIAQWAAAHAPDIRILKPEKVNDPAVLNDIRGTPHDAFVVIAFGQKLGRSLLNRVFAINLHASLLPRWRGAAPINAAMLAGDPTTGNSVITLADRMDAGLILGQTTRPINPLQTAGELHDQLAADGPDLIIDVLQRHTEGALRPIQQDDSLVTLTGKLSRADAWVDFSQDATECARRIHGLTPWPGVLAALDAGGADIVAEIKLLRVQARAGLPEQPIMRERTPGDPRGILIDPITGLIGCGQGSALELHEVQPPGKRPMRWAEYARGHHPAINAMIWTRSQPPSARQASAPHPDGGAAC
ncbi:MAG: methionyl-tRNA formyltransferase [Phycisphaerales bacterium]|nr:methionyl-tRNA formyltransferase [Phycisphaerales bacterium]